MKKEDKKEILSEEEFCHNHSQCVWKYKIIIQKEEPKPIHEQIIEHCGGKEKFMEICGLKPKQETLEEAADAIETKYTNGKRNNFKYDIDWVKYILWTIICVCFGMVLGMFTTKLIYGL
jgi:hypothetical protein